MWPVWNEKVRVAGKRRLCFLPDLVSSPQVTESATKRSAVRLVSDIGATQRLGPELNQPAPAPKVNPDGINRSHTLQRVQLDRPLKQQPIKSNHKWKLDLLT